MKQQTSQTEIVLRPLSDHVVVLPNEWEKVTKGGIHLPDVAKDKPRKGKVVAVGPGEFTRYRWSSEKDDPLYKPMPVQVGQTVYFAKWSGTDVEENGKTYLVMPLSQILCVVEET